MRFKLTKTERYPFGFTSSRCEKCGGPEGPWPFCDPKGGPDGHGPGTYSFKIAGGGFSRWNRVGKDGK